MTPQLVPQQNKLHTARSTKCNGGFQQELSVVTSDVRSYKGTPLTSVTRGTNIALSSRSIAKLNVTSATQAHNLVTFSNHARNLGNGLVVLDFGSRIVNVHKSYKADGDWERLWKVCNYRRLLI